MRSSFVVATMVATSFAAHALAGGSLYFDRAQFNADANTGATAVEGFDSYDPGSNLTGATLNGMTLTGAANMPLMVIRAADGVRNPMASTSGMNVLSPGGSNIGLEEDDLTITFATAVQAFGLDVIFDAPDGASFVGVTFRDVTGAIIASNGFIPAPNGAPGFTFVGFVSDRANIASVTFDEFDPSPLDDHVAYDSLTVSVPTPGSLALLGIGGMVIARRGRR
ncbi:MAG: hypothetical protein SFY96_03295 [Planctomycetota bacterium]|nr:hypothetical protein [Planctomycetota bacterium]